MLAECTLMLAVAPITRERNPRSEGIRSNCLFTMHLAPLERILLSARDVVDIAVLDFPRVAGMYDAA